MNPPPPGPQLTFDTPQAWDEWLDANHPTSTGVWLRLAKKGSGVTTVTYAEAIDVALCHGWIDGQSRPDNEPFWLQKFSPRAAKSLWSKINREKVRVLIESGRMKPAGLLQVERARSDGRWDNAYDSSRTATVPDDLQAALDLNPTAKAFFETLNRQNRYAILFRIQTVKKAETRARKIQTFVTMLEKQEKLYP